MTAVARGVFLLETSFSAFAKGYFRLGVSTIGGADTLAVSQNDPRWTGEFSDLTAKLESAVWRRGQINADGAIDEGTATITVRDPDGDFDPYNSAGPFFATLGERLHPIRLRGRTQAGSLQGQLYMFIRKAHWKPSKRRAVTVFDCVDLFYWLNDAKPVIAATGATTTGAAIGKILDSIGWLDPTMRSLATGDSIPDFSADGTKTALGLIKDLLLAERGRFFIDGDGIATYESRHAVALRSSAATIDSVMRALAPGWDTTTVGNMLTVQRQGGVAQVATDSDSRNRFGDRELSQITTPYLSTDSQALALGKAIVAEEKSSKKPLRTLDIDNREEALLTQILTRELGHVVTVTEDRLNTTGEYAIDRLECQLGRAGRVSAAWTMRKKPVRPFVIGTSTIGGADPFTY